MNHPLLFFFSFPFFLLLFSLHFRLDMHSIVKQAYRVTAWFPASKLVSCTLFLLAKFTSLSPFLSIRYFFTFLLPFSFPFPSSYLPGRLLLVAGVIFTCALVSAVGDVHPSPAQNIYLPSPRTPSPSPSSLLFFSRMDGKVGPRTGWWKTLFIMSTPLLPVERARGR